MGIQEVGTKGKENIQGYQSRKKSGNAQGFQQRLMQNLQSRSQEQMTETTGKMQESADESEKAVDVTEAGREKDRTNVSVSTGVQRIRVSTAARCEAVQSAEVRHMSYEESDHVEIAVTKGYTLKGKALGQQVYVEAKYEDGRQEAYHVDLSKVQEKTEHRIERFALETADCVTE